MGNNLSQLSLEFLSRAVVDRWRTASVMAALIFAGLAMLVFSLKPEYTASTLVLLSPASEELRNGTADPGTPMTDPFFIRSETDILSSDELARSVIQSLQLWELADFQPHPGLRERLGIPTRSKAPGPLSEREVLLDRVALEYGDRLTVYNDGRSKTVAIGFTASDPRVAAKIANAHAEAYLQQQASRKIDAQQSALAWLAKEVDARAAELRQANTDVQQYQLKHGIVSANAATMVEQRLSQVSTQLGEARRNLSAQLALLSEIRNVRAGGDAGNVSAMLTDEPLKNLLQSRVQAEANLASLEKRLAPTHPWLVKQRQELASINKVLNAQLARLEKEAESGASSWQAQVRDLTDTVGAETAKKQDQDRVATALPSLIAQEQVKRAVFETVLNRYQTLLAERGFLAPSATIVSRALPPATPSFPRTTLFLAVALLASLMGGAAVAILLVLRRPPPMGLTALADSLGIPPLVSIPRFRNRSREDGVVHIDDPRLYIESIRFLREAVFESKQQGRCTTCLVASTVPRQGKSLVAMSLARATARAGRKTLFIEADLRQPTASVLARRPFPELGMGALLQGRANISAVLVRDAGSGLDMLLAERDARFALDRLTPAVVRELLSKLGNQYDAIIIDSPPVGIVADALIFAPLVEQTILVTKEADASLAELHSGVRLLRQRGATVAGLVLTSIDPKTILAGSRKTVYRYAMGIPTPDPHARPAAASRERIG